MTDIQQPSFFDYLALEPSLAGEVRAAAERIKIRLRRSAEDIIAVGQDLIAVKASLPHGQFGEWLQAEFEMSERTARSFMNVGEQFGGKTANFAVLTPSALYALAAPSTPEPVRQEVIQRVEAGESVSHKEIAELKRQAAEAAQRAAEAERQTALFQEQLDAAERELTKAAKDAQHAAGLRSQLAALDAELKALREKPPEVVTVEKIPEGYTSAAEAEKAKRKEIERLDLQARQLRSQIEESERRSREYTSREEQIRRKHETMFMFKAAIAKALQVKPEAEILLATDAMNEPIRQELQGIKTLLETLLGTVNKALAMGGASYVDALVVEA